MTTDPYARRFGVEIECGIPGGVMEVARLFRFETDEYGNLRARHDGWKLGADGSGAELKTPPLQGEAGLRKVRQAMERLKNAGAYVTNRDGLHIHHDAPEFVANPRLAVKLARSWMNNIHEIHEMVHPDRRSSSHCPRWSEDYFQILERWARGEDELRTRRHDLNLYALRKHGTIEIRLHEGTLDADVMEAWVKFGQRLIHEVASRPRVMQPTKKRNFMERIRLAPEATAILAEKQQFSYRTPASAYRPSSY